MPSGRFAFFPAFSMYTRRSGRARYPRRRSSRTANAFRAELVQISLSTPGVHLPLFSVTRLTANARPLNEWVNRCCRACALFHRPASVAFTMRAWRRLTFASHWFQLICSQSERPWEVAPRAR